MGIEVSKFKRNHPVWFWIIVVIIPLTLVFFVIGYFVYFYFRFTGEGQFAVQKFNIQRHLRSYKNNIKSFRKNLNNPDTSSVNNRLPYILKFKTLWITLQNNYEKITRVFVSELDKIEFQNRIYGMNDGDIAYDAMMIMSRDNNVQGLLNALGSMENNIDRIIVIPRRRP